MNFDLRNAGKRFTAYLGTFKVQPWMIYSVVGLMVSLLVLGLVAWVVPNVAAQTATEEPFPTLVMEAAAPEPTTVPTATPTATPTPAPTAIPERQVVWTENVSVYLLEDPGEHIIGSIPNGDQVTLRNGVSPVAYGGYTWVPVRYEMVDGWLAENQVYTLRPGFLLVAEPGTNLRAEPAGSKVLWLSPGTAFHVVETADNWQQIELPDGRTGWVNRASEAIRGAVAGD